MKEIEVEIIRWGKKSYYIFAANENESGQLAGGFRSMKSALALCEYHHLLITGYYKNGVKVAKEEME